MSKEKDSSPIILAVDDDRTMLMTLEAKLKKQKYEVITASGGKEACEKIKKLHDKIDAILLDRMMPDMDGIEVINWLKEQDSLNKPPIIMQTGADRPEQVEEGINAGVFYYLIKPIQEEVLSSVVSSAVRESQQKKSLRSELGKHKLGFKLMKDSVINLKTVNEAESASCFLANCFPDSQAILPALAELMVNAVEHGSLGISYDEKTELIDKGQWQEEIEKRQNLPENKDKFVKVFFKKDNSKYMVKIVDQGKGFPWKKFINLNPARALDNHGRGIARANAVFTDLQYNREGNELVAIFDESKSQDIDW